MIPTIHEIYCDNCDTSLVKVNDKLKINEEKEYMSFISGGWQTKGTISFHVGKWGFYLDDLRGDFCDLKCFVQWLEKKLKEEKVKNSYKEEIAIITEKK